jgi:ABC-type dipeptide/oligopeptide/nickel transport system ATPase component
VVTNRLYFDFDSKNDVEAARKDAVEMCHRLIDSGIPDTSLNAFFSGQKGFGIEVATDTLMTPQTFKNTVFDLADGLKTFDQSVNDPARIIRIPGTPHQKSGLYKIPLELWQLDELDVNEVLELAKSPIILDTTRCTTSLPKSFSKYIEKPKKKEEPKPISVETHETVDTLLSATRPPNLDDARWLLYNGFFDDGERNTALLCLASTLKNSGQPKEIVYRILKGVAQLQSDRTGTDRFPDTELYNNIVSQVYGNHWKNGQFSIRDPQSWLHRYAVKHGLNTEDKENAPVKFIDVEGQFIDFVKNIEQNTIATGIKCLDDKMAITTGMVMGIVGAASSGKTSLCLDVLGNTSKNNVTSVFASLDMYRTRIFEKLTYRVTGGSSREEIYEMYKTGKASEITRKINEEFGNTYFYDRSSPTVQNIRDYVLNVQQKTGEKVKLVMIDYFERISSDASDDTAASKRISSELQDMMNDLNTCVVVLFQPNKAALSGGPDSPILNYASIKGSSFVFQSLRNIISIWRPFFNPKSQEKDRFMQMAILKNDLGTLDVFDLGWTGRTGRIYELEDHQREELHELLKHKEEQKSKETGSWK